jgi:Uma2 family endonuclease
MQQLTAPARQEQRIPMSYDEFLVAFEDSTHAEWVNGEAIVFMPPTIRHQRIVQFLALLLAMYVRSKRMGEVLFAPVEMRALPEGNAREPDILYVAREHQARITDKRINGPADLIVEVISPESVSRDRADKFYEYEQAGVREYWLIDPRPGYERADFWVLDEAGRYAPVPLDAQGIYRSAVIPGFWLNVNWLWEEELPDYLRIFAQIAGLSIS